MANDSGINAVKSIISCSMSNLSRSAIEDVNLWTLNPTYLFGSPVVAAVKFMVTLLLFAIGLVLFFRTVLSKTERRRAMYPILLNQAITIVLMSLTQFIFGLVIDFSPSGEFAYGRTDFVRCGICQFAGFLFILFNTVLLHTVTLVFLVLYEQLVLVFSSKLSKNVNILIIILVWIISFLIAVAPIGGFGSYEFDGNFGACIPIDTGHSRTGVVNRTYIVFLYLEGLVPVCISIIAALKTCRATVKHVRQYITDGVGSKFLKKPQRVFEIFFSSIIFGIFWVPLFVIAFVIIGYPMLSSEVYIICWLFYITNPLFQLVFTVLTVKIFNF